MKKIFFLMLTLLVWSTASVNAQVRIGGIDDPNESAVLDLNATNATNNGTLGLALPRVELTSTGSYSPLEAHVAGMTVYNTNTTDDVTPGAYYNDGTKWIRIGNGSLISEVDGVIGNEVTTATENGGLAITGDGTVGSPLSVGITSQGVATEHLADGAVTTAKIANESVTAAKLASGVLSSTAAPKITTQPKSFSWSRKYDANGDPSGPSTVTGIVALSVTATGPGTLTYKWYKKATNKNAADILVAETQNYAPVVTAWGMNSYYCVVSNANGSVTSNIADVAIGCGAKTATGGWLKFMCYNLGATTTGDPFVFTANDSTILGKFYQWGRPGANHRAATDTTNFTTSWGYPYDWKIPAGYNKTITNTYRQDDYLWRNLKNGANDPCPTGWHVPSQSAFAAIFKGTTDADVPANATANTWSPIGTWASGTGGYAVKPDGSTTTLFFPAAGFRRNGASLNNVGLEGRYWSSTTSATVALHLAIGSERVYPSDIGLRGDGLSVRCVSE